MLERLIVTLCVLVLSVLTVRLMRRRQRRHVEHVARRLDRGVHPPAIVYFRSAACAQCAYVQSPILDRVMAASGARRLRLVTYDVDDVPDVAKAWGVRTLPTTIVVDRHGNVVHVNNGLVTEAALRRQLVN
jgi:thioredoxin-like negative regulator of GroEL